MSNLPVAHSNGFFSLYYRHLGLEEAIIIWPKAIFECFFSFRYAQTVFIVYNAVTAGGRNKLKVRLLHE